MNPPQPDPQQPLPVRATRHPSGVLVPLYAQLQSIFLLPVGAALFALALTVGLVAKSYGSDSPDLAVDVEMSESRNPVLNALGLAINYCLAPPGAMLLLAGICLWLLVLRRAPIRSLAFGSITAIGWLSAEIGKFTVARLRPPHGIVHALVNEPGHDSFPSGHTAYAAALAWAVILVLTRPGAQRRWAILIGVLFTSAVALSRLYVGAHYPTDVIGSLLISTAGIFLWLAVWNALLEPRLQRARLLTLFTGKDLPAPEEEDLLIDGR